MKKFLRHLNKFEGHVLDALKGGESETLSEKLNALAHSLFKGEVPFTVINHGEKIVYCHTDGGDVFIASSALIPHTETKKEVEAYLNVLDDLGKRFSFNSEKANALTRKILTQAIETITDSEILLGFVASSQGFLCSLTRWRGKIDLSADVKNNFLDQADYFEQTPLIEGGVEVGSKIIFILDSD